MEARRVLIVDGSSDCRMVYSVMLEHYGFEVHEAADGACGLDLARSGSFAVVVTELTLRWVDGHSLLQALRSDAATARTHAVVITARSLPEDRMRAEQAGCSAFLVKPFEPQTLVREIQKLTEVKR